MLSPSLVPYLFDALAISLGQILPCVLDPPSLVATLLTTHICLFHVSWTMEVTSHASDMQIATAHPFCESGCHFRSLLNKARSQ